MANIKKRKIFKIIATVIGGVIAICFAFLCVIAFFVVLYDYDEFESVTYKKQKYYLCEGLYFNDVEEVEDEKGKKYCTNCHKIDVKEQKLWETGGMHRMYMYDDGTESYIYDKYTGLWYSPQKPNFELSVDNIERIIICELQAERDSYEEFEYEFTFEERQDFIDSILENRQNVAEEITLEHEDFPKHCVVRITYKGQPTNSYWASFGVWIYEEEVVVSGWEENMAKQNELTESCIKIENSSWADEVYAWLQEIRK